MTTTKADIQSCNLSPIERFVLLISLSLAAFMMVLDYSIANVSIPYIAGDLSVSTDQGTYVITSFAVGNAIGLAMTGWLTKRVGVVKLMSIAIALFTILSLLCGLSVNLTMLIVARFVQGLVAGPIIPLSQSLIIQTTEKKNVLRDLSIWSLIIITGPVIGPILGGYISDWYHWSWIFYINVPVGVFCLISLWAIMKNHESGVEKAPSDYIGMIMLAVGVTCLQILLDKGQQWDWLNSNLIWVLLIGTIMAFTLLVIRELYHSSPFLELRLFATPSFSLSIICLMVSYGIYFGTIVLVPLWLQEYMGYNAEWAGLAVSFLGIAPIFLGAFTPKLINKLGSVLTLLISFVVFGLACFYTSFFTTEVDFHHIAFSRFLFGIGFTCYITPLIEISVQDVPSKSLPSATGIFHFMRAMVGGIGTSVFTTLWQRRTYFHHERVGSALTPYNPITPHAADEHSLELLNNGLDQQAALLAINDAFFLMAWLFGGLVVLLLGWYFFSRNKKRNRVVLPVSGE
jgi:DHA2 family multidrug resistance protein